MISKRAILATAIGGLLAVNLGASAFAADAKDDTEKCYGVVKAGKNDCAGTGHACSGQGKKDGADSEWIKLPKGTCDRIVGGSLTPKK
jgi:uncharacterized membrane protein